MLGLGARLETRLSQHIAQTGPLPFYSSAKRTKVDPFDVLDGFRALSKKSCQGSLAQIRAALSNAIKATGVLLFERCRTKAVRILI